jgi:putative spermidine/putrescine transport system permease protein
MEQNAQQSALFGNGYGESVMSASATMAGNKLLGRIARWALGLYVLMIAAFLLAPIVAITAGSLTTSRYVSFPPQGLTLKWYTAILEQPRYLEALGLSIGIGAGAATIATVLGLMVALAIHRHKTWANRLLETVVLTPVMLPSIFIGLAFLVAYSRMGIGGSPLGLLAGHVITVTPFTVSMILVGLGGVNPDFEKAARSLGASPWKCLRRVTLPLIAWSLATGWGFAFMMSFGSLEVSLFLSTPKMVTLPVAIYTALEWSPLDPMLTAISSGLVIITLVVLLTLAQAVRFDRVLKASSPSS